MRTKALIFILAAAAAQAGAQTAGGAAQPARQVALAEEQFGIRIEDPYRWMEEPANAAEMSAWVAAQSARAIPLLEALPERAAFARRLEETTRAGVRYSDVQSVGSRLFYRRLDPADRVPKLVVRENGRERVLFDPVAGTSEVRAISNYSPSPDGRIVAVHVAGGGGEVGETRFIDTATGVERGTRIGPIWGEFSVDWLSNSRIAFTRITRPEGADQMQNMRADVLDLAAGGAARPVLGAGVAGGPDYGPNEFPVVSTSPVSDWVLGFGTGARADARLLIASEADVAAGRPAWREVGGYDARINGAALLGDTLFIASSLDNPNGAIVARTIGRTGLSAPRSLATPDDMIFENMAATRDGLYVSGHRDGVSRLLYFPRGRGPAREVALPGEGSIFALQTDKDGRSVVFGRSSWFAANDFYRATAGRAEPLGLRSATWPGVARFSAVREEAVSADGTRVPMVILLPEGGRRDGGMPTILEGYASYGVTELSPGYNAYDMAWLARGGAFALCGARGGGERGRIWHEGGRSANRANSIADYVACAERLAAAGYASASQLVGTGTSAGGLLVPPAAIGRPDLFTAIIPRVAILNPTRLAAAPNGPNQFAEMGDPGTESGFRALAAQDSYLLLAQARDVPDMLITVGLNDRRVVPWMAAKFAARALSRFGDRRTILVRADPEAGHGIGSARDRLIAEWADTFAFAWAQAGGR
jgi:prolyl oligopeptidase